MTVEQITGFPEILDGRVKTLHPAIHGGILAVPENERHLAQLNDHNIVVFDMVVVNLYPFEQTIMREGLLFADAIEQIDIGGVALIRAAAKNHRCVLTVTDPSQYELVLEELRNPNNVVTSVRRQLAYEAFHHTAWYDATIAEWFGRKNAPKFPERTVLRLRKKDDLRYGENPHQSGAFYELPGSRDISVASATQIWGNELSATTVLDINAGIETVRDFFPAYAVAIIKHGTLCGAAIGKNILQAFQQALACDPESAFGGVVVLNAKVTNPVAKAICNQKVDAIVAPEFTPNALALIQQKRRKGQTPLVTLEGVPQPLPAGALNFKSVTNGMIVQQADIQPFDWSTFRTVTERPVPDEQWNDITFGCRISKHVKSNSIVVVRNYATIGIGNGQTSRIKSARLALEQAHATMSDASLDLSDAVLVSDSFFPFDDCVRLAAEYGIRVIIQQGGSLRDQDSIDAANELGIAMLFTGRRMFWH